MLYLLTISFFVVFDKSILYHIYKYQKQSKNEAKIQRIKKR